MGNINYMSSTKKRKRKRRSVIRVYVARAIALFIAFNMLVLMFCGCLYIRDHFFRKDKTQNIEQNDAASGGEDQEASNQPIKQPVVKTDEYAEFSVVIDPGHGGNDGGTSNGDIIEKDVNLAISLKLAELLENKGVKVFLTREDDDFLSLEERAYHSNQATGDFFISLHCNYFEDDASITGFETFYPKNADADIYAENIAKAAEESGVIDVRGAKENNYYVTRKVEMDAILVEMGFLSNDEESKKLASEDYQNTLAEVISKGIFTTFDEKKTAQ